MFKYWWAATTGKYRETIVPELTAMDALKRWERQEKIAVEQTDYAISLQRAIEAHCRGKVAETTECPHHAEKLNECLARHNG